MSRLIRCAIALGSCIAVSLVVPQGFSAQAAGNQDPLTISDADLNRNVADIENDVRRQQAEVDSATQAMNVAANSANQSEAELTSISTNMDELHRLASDSAVREYMNPVADGFKSVLASGEVAEAQERTVLLAQINDRNKQAYENLKAARAELDRERSEAEHRRSIADERRRTAQAKLDSLNQVLERKRQMQEALNQRQQNADAEQAAAAANPAPAAAPAAKASRAVASAMSDDSRQSAAGMRWPAQGPIRSPFGARWGRQHTGIDIGAPEGAPIYAAKAGTVFKASMDNGGYGNLVQIDNGSNVVTYYAHMSRIATNAGDHVEAGQLIGYIGHTGHVVPASTAGAHLHFEVRIGGTPRDPQQYLP